MRRVSASRNVNRDVRRFMRTKILILTACIFATVLAAGFYPSGTDSNTIALAVKVIFDVSKKSPTVDWAKAKKGDMLYSGDEIRTGERSIAIVKFKDNSMLRVREKSELKVYGEQKEGVFSKTVHVTSGEFSFDIQKQQDEQFTFSSPTSVAAIRGTQGDMQHLDNGDIVTVLEGVVNLLNVLSNTSVTLNSGETGFSGTDGTINKHHSTAKEHNNAQNSLNSASETGQIKMLRIELQDPQGNKKLMKIRYRE